MSYQYPSIELLDSVGIYEEEPESQEEMKQNAEIIRQTLADFRIKVEPGPITQGPTVTRYEFIPDRGIRMSRIIELSDNIAAVLKAVSINILAPIPGKNAIGIETPNNNHVPVSMREMVPVSMREMLESKEWANTKAQLPIALGEDLYHKPIITDLAKAPHLLIAGSTGSGKSVCINSIITSLLYKFSPEQLRFIMVDPKQVELQQYNDLAHMIVPVITDPKKAVLALRWLVEEMEKRYTMFAKAGVRNIEGFNSHSVDGEKLFYIVLIIDELNDLMLIAGKKVEEQIMRITQLARAAGIHCIIATQRPSVDVITGVIKANIPARIAFNVSNRQNSNTILDSIGAEKLLGYGDMLFLPPGKPKKRIQG
ncbi:MAG: DNA translocase FtsK, partial [Verrucomicrobia bacterium]|nr:DNA translocase FtsK [Verrucomicrobiota bacterium]